MAKKTSAHHPQKKQVSPMPPPHAHLVNSEFATAVAHRSPLQEDDDDDLDDICPVCESECTCRKKSSVPSISSAPTPSVSSSLSSAPSNYQQSTTAGKRPLKIKLTLPSNLKSRKPPKTQLPYSSAHLGAVVSDAGPSSRQPIYAAAPAPKRRGRPPKASTSKCNARKNTAIDDMEYKARGTSGPSTTARPAYHPVTSTSVADLSDSTLSDYPTFVPAANELAHSSSSESSDSSIDSDTPNDHYVAHNDNDRHSTKLLPGHVGHKKRERIAGNKWEIKPRKRSVGAGEDEDEESSTDNESSDDSSEDGDDENEDGDEDEDADAEGVGMIAESSADLDEEETHGRLGLSFPGDGWSDDEDSSFDADVFFAGLDSDSGTSSPEMHSAALRTFAGGEDIELSGSFSADEEDALLLMGVDPSMQLRRGHSEFEIGVDLDNLSFDWDGHLLFSNTANGSSDGIALSFAFDALDEDEEMASISGSDATSPLEDSGTGTVILHESDGDTTEDELVDSDGLPNPRAMMLFKWPSTISAINPLSTLSPSSFSDTPPEATPSTRIALASMSRRWSPPPTPSPADILAGRVSMDDLEDIEMDKLDKQKGATGRWRGVPVMGEFIVDDALVGRKTAVVGSGSEVPSFYRRPLHPSKSEPMVEDAHITDEHIMTSIRAQVGTESLEERIRGMSQQSYVSDSTTEVIDLDDVLDSSLLDDEPSNQECDTDVPDSESSPSKPGASPHLQNLSRWDRIPMTTFRRTRENATVLWTSSPKHRYFKRG